MSRADERPRVGIWPWSLREPIPIIPVPLQPGDPDARLDVKAALDQVYDLGHYADEIYDGPPEPGLRTADAAWAAPFVPPATPR